MVMHVRILLNKINYILIYYWRDLTFRNVVPFIPIVAWEACWGTKSAAGEGEAAQPTGQADRGASTERSGAAEERRTTGKWPP